MIAGIDEAGRGSVIGPLVIGLVAGPSSKFSGRGYKDSKLLTPSRREDFLEMINSSVYSDHIAIGADELNHLMGKGISLNEIEAMKAAVLIDSAPKDVNKVYVDSPDPVPQRFVSRISKYLKRKDLEIIAEHKADLNYPVVSAASIVAKVNRDRAIKSIREELGLSFSSGYPSDESTIDALKYMLKEKVGYKYIRFKWKTVENLLSQQKRLFDFF